MSIRDIGPLRAADESLNHQIIDTFAIVAESERSWTEKVWVSIARTDGSLQLDFGLGTYHNCGIIDGFGGVSRGREQWTVRGSREGDATGYGIMESMISGVWPDLGLRAESDHQVSYT
jgi:hypothetical protein